MSEFLPTFVGQGSYMYKCTCDSQGIPSITEQVNCHTQKTQVGLQQQNVKDRNLPMTTTVMVTSTAKTTKLQQWKQRKLCQSTGSMEMVLVGGTVMAMAIATLATATPSSGISTTTTTSAATTTLRHQASPQCYSLKATTLWQNGSSIGNSCCHATSGGMIYVFL